MRNFKLIIAATTVGLFCSTSAYAENPLPSASDVLVQYGEVEDWTVYANETRGDCLIVRSVGMNKVQLGVTAQDQEVGYLGVFTKADIGLKDGTQSEIFVSIDGTLYEGVATSMQGGIKGGYSGGYILTNNPDFGRDVAKKYEMIVFPETKGAFVLDLKGTFKAMAMGRKCLEEQPSALIKPLK